MVIVRAGSLLLSLLFMLASHRVASAQMLPIRITADLTESSRRLYHTEIDLPVHAGPAVFTSPLWIPGSHSPNGPIGSIAGVVFTANGKVLPWHRDGVALAEFHLEIPAGVRSIHAHVDALVASRATRQMAMLEWDTLMLYPAHVPVSEITIQPAVTLPAGWGVGTALTEVDMESTPRSALAEQADHLPPADAVTTRYAQTRANLDGIVRGGYALVYTDQPTTAERILSDPDSPLYVGEDFWYTLGLRVDSNGTVMDVRWGSPADKAKLAPKQKLLTVNGAPYSAAVLHKAIAGANHDRNALRLLLRQDGGNISADMEYHGGERFPDLKRGPSGSASLDMITKPRSE